MLEGDHKGHPGTVAFRSANEEDFHQWWAVNTGSLQKDLSEIVSPELAEHLLDQLGLGYKLEFPNRYALDEVMFKFGGRWS